MRVAHTRAGTEAILEIKASTDPTAKQIMPFIKQAQVADRLKALKRFVAEYPKN